VFDPETRVDIPPQVGMAGKTGLEFTGKETRKADFETLLKAQVRDKTAYSVTGELAWNWGKGMLTVNTARSQGFTGFPKGETQALSNLETTLENAYGTLVASSLDAKPLSQSGRVLVSAIGNAINTGMETVPAGNQLQSPGGLPVLVEPLVGKVKLVNLEGDLSKAVVYYLNPSGKRVGKVPSQIGKASLVFDMKPAYKTMHYEIFR
jgi:hypothetical protein